ncbi:MAG: caspase family protein [Pseudomonadota bacterium]
MTFLRNFLCAQVFAFNLGFAAGATPCAPTALEKDPADCLAHAETLAQDVAALKKLGRQLELVGAYQVALQVYRLGLTQTPTNKSLQQAYIRSRSEVKARRMIADLLPNKKTKPTSLCLSTRFIKAIEACQKELAADSDNALLHQKLGDALRSVGRPVAALTAYGKSLELQEDEFTRRKFDTLSELVEMDETQGPLLVGRRLNLPTDTAVSISRPRPIPVAPRPEVAVSTPASLAEPHNQTLKKQSPIQLSGQYKALLIGNRRYKNFPHLVSPVNDVEAMSDLLTHRYGFQVDLVIDASRYEIFQALAALRKETRPEDSVLVYYAGHGYLDEVTSRGYWLPIDSENDNAANWISTSDITDLLAGLPARHVLVVADSCFSGALVRSGLGVNLDERNSLLRRLYASRSRNILTSGGLEPVLDGGSAKHSVFAFSLLEALRHNTGVIEAERLFVTIRDRVSYAAEQVPQYGPLRAAGHEGGDFIFVPKNLQRK